MEKQNSSVGWRSYVDRILTEHDLRYQQRFDAQAQAIKDALLAAEKAVSKAETATEKRFDSVNEFRKALTDQTSTFVSRIEFDSLKERLDRAEGRAGGYSSLWGYIAAAGGLIIAALTIILK